MRKIRVPRILIQEKMKLLCTARRTVQGMLVTSTLLAFASSALYSAPSLDIRKPPVISGLNPFTGPNLNDPTAQGGQWFGTTGNVFTLDHEFHDNAVGRGGGIFGTKAIWGRVAGVVFSSGPGTKIVSFNIRAVVRNDTDTVSGSWRPGSNSHGERRSTAEFYKGPLLQPVLVTEFALTSNTLFPLGPIGGTPYLPSPGPRIIAINHTVGAWYCFSNTRVPGNYYVPGWQLPTIPVGGSASVSLQFKVIDGGLLPSDPRYKVLMDSATNGSDVLSNRTTSLKIGGWVEGMFTDTGAPYFRVNRSSDAAVFHMIEFGL